MNLRDFYLGLSATILLGGPASGGTPEFQTIIYKTIGDRSLVLNQAIT